MLELEFQYYLDHQEEFVEKYLDKFLVIKNQEIVGVHDTKIEAYETSMSKFEIGKFLIQQCLPGSISHTQTFHSQVMLRQVSY